MNWTKWDHDRLHDGCGGEDGCEQPDAPPCTKNKPEPCNTLGVSEDA